ncbi:hypothetical protein EMIHUDRAFT_108187 [Emiliania huxleyi CCMP1516]|uniref:Uncharacterized protein n=2 Tax=Emiliania huxleyi TaxID=2903 RepID=A0A0D3KZ13_EMIH1|nr:hypothetical protein EMIHUDRAFT_108187 [Emiliania huxleyi CCMP1516]EOD40998.1 hypothetical protein EMIHUDRAFT_108187 [Emiliania huxleyi CCMP1516]|eukprot:XP_005793427.1 hypothetical protein EMIHUDRAFT_108187 [Emiliania huxleyi CCMP1516]
MSSVRVDSHQPCCGLAAASSDPPSPVAAAAEVGSSSGTGAAGGCSPMPRVCGVRFGSVDVLYHSVHLDDSKLPSDGLAPLGLGELQRREHLQVDSFERQRCGQRCDGGAMVIPPAERASLAGMKRQASLEAIEKVNEQLRLERASSVREFIQANSLPRTSPPPYPRLDNLSLVRVLLRSGVEAAPPPPPSRPSSREPQPAPPPLGSPPLGSPFGSAARIAPVAAVGGGAELDVCAAAAPAAGPVAFRAESGDAAERAAEALAAAASTEV